MNNSYINEQNVNSIVGLKLQYSGDTNVWTIASEPDTFKEGVILLDHVMTPNKIKWLYNNKQNNYWRFDKLDDNLQDNKKIKDILYAYLIGLALQNIFPSDILISEKRVS